MEYCLRQIEHGNPYPLKIDLDEDIMIGSDSNHTLSRYPLVSPCHAHFVRKRGGWSVRDLDSTHGTFVNSYRIGNKLQKLQLGDQIGFGAKCFTDGFICALDFKKPEKKTPEIIDLIHDTPVKDEPPDSDARGNGPSTSSAGRLERYTSQRHCFVPLVRCDSERFKFPPDVRKVNMRNSAFEITAVGDNVSHRQFEPHTHMNIIGESSSTDCRSNPYKMLRKCYISLVRCDSLRYSVPYDLQPFPGDKKELIPIMTKSRCTDTSYGETSKFLSENKKPTKSVGKVIKVRNLENGVSSVLGLVNRRRIVSSDSSDSDTSDFPNNRFDQRKTSISLDTTGSVHSVTGKRTNEIVSKSSLDLPIVSPSSVSEAPQEKVRILENGVSSVLSLVNRRRIVSSDSSDLDTSDFLNNRFDQRKTTGSIRRVAGKRANEIVPKSGLNIPIVPPSSVSEALQSTINLQSLFPGVFSSCFHHQQGIELNSAKSKQISGNNDKEFIESEDESLGYSHEEEEMIVSDVEESYVGHKPFPAAKHDSLTNYDLNELKILENIRNTLRSQIRDYNQLPSSIFSTNAAENIDSSVNISGNLDKHSLFDCSTLKYQSRLDGLPPLVNSYIDSATNHVGVLEENHYNLNESVKKQETAGGESSPDHEYHSDSSVASMDYIITSSIGKTGLNSSEEKKNVSFDSPENTKNFQHDLSTNTKSNYLVLLNSSENVHVNSNKGKNSLDSLEIRKNDQHDSSNRTKSNYLAVLNSSENVHVEASVGKNGLDSSEIKKNIQHDLSNRTKSNYLALLNSSEDGHVDSSEDKSSTNKTRRTLPIEALPLRRHSKKFNREEKQPCRKRASQIPSPNSKFSQKRKHSPVALSAKMPNGIMPASFKIPKVSKPPQQEKGGQKEIFISEQNKTTKTVNCSSRLDKKCFSISRNPKNTSGSERRLADMGTKDFKKRPKKKDEPLMNKLAGMRKSNDTSNANKLISVLETTCNGLGNVGKIHDEDENDNIYNISVIISNRIEEEPCETYSIVNSNLTVLSPSCNSFFTTEGLTSSENSLNCSDPSTFRSLSLEQTLSNSKDSNEKLISSTKEAIEVSPNASTSSIVHEFAELIRRTISAAQTSSVDNVIPCTSVSEIRDIVAVTPVPSTSKKLNAVDFDVPKSPRNIGTFKANVPAGPSRVLVANTFSDTSTSKFNLDAVLTDPRIKLTIPCAEQLSFTHQASHSSESPVKQVYSSNECNSPSFASKVNKLLSSAKTGIENPAFVTNSQVALASPTSDQLSYVNKRLTSNVFNRTPSVAEVKLVAIPESKSNSTSDLPDARPNVASCCPEQLPRVQQRLSSTESIGKPNSVVISYLRMIKNVVSLNLKWLEEQTNNNKPPPEVSKGAAILPRFFSSFDQYVSSFVPMLMLEIWKKMFDEYKMICEHALLSKEFGFIILSHKNHKNELEMSEYNCEAVVDKRTFEPCDGNLVIMHIIDIKGNCHQILCYIHVHKTEQLSIANSNPEWNKVHNMQTQNPMLCKFSAYAKLRPMMPLVNKKMNGNGICFIKNKLMLADALQKLETSPLCPSVLYPQIDVFSVNRDTSVDSQEAAVESLSNELRKPIATPKILLLRGPPGTGKSYIIVTLLQKLIHKERAKVKILLTAPSDVAVDEIGFRLIKKKLNFVRFGSLHFINERIRPFTLAAKAEKLKEESIRKTEQRKERLEKLLTEIAVMKITDSKCEKKLRPLVREKLALEKKIFMETNADTSHRNYQHEALRDADVILTSLGGCGDPRMSVFKPNTPLAFTCCIVDHASQCTEMDILPALVFGMSKLVLVGDPVQPTPMVHSKWTAQYGYEKSMFERFHHYFSEYTSVSPSLTLEKQFRMHSEICFFPSKQFYNNGLKTPPDVDVRYLSFPFHPYIVYDISERQEPKLISSSEHCADFIFTICNQLLLLKKLTFSIGILVPTREDRKIFLKKLSKQKALQKHVEVNTVEGFQGREKDMVLMSCSNSSGIGRPNFLSCDRRFNVALTRARKCLIVCIGSSTLKQTPFWQNLIRDATDRRLYSPAISIKDITLTFLPTMLKQI